MDISLLSPPLSPTLVYMYDCMLLPKVCHRPPPSFSPYHHFLTFTFASILIHDYPSNPNLMAVGGLGDLLELYMGPTN